MLDMIIAHLAIGSFYLPFVAAIYLADKADRKQLIG